MGEIIQRYISLGFSHVLPWGYDHIVFILSMCLLDPRVKTILIQCSLFTLAHSITLGLTALGVVFPSMSLVEPLIAISILYTAVENILLTGVHKFRFLIIFLFGLIHGMGFASALREIGIPKEYVLSSLISFNVGVELGQLAVVFAAYFACVKWIMNKSYYKPKFLYPISVLIGCVAIYWTLDRVVN